MRNWNGYLVQQEEGGVRIYYLPMRNWNIHDDIKWNDPEFDLLLTYEELKQVIGYIFENPELNLLLTYEELKLDKPNLRQHKCMQ